MDFGALYTRWSEEQGADPRHLSFDLWLNQGLSQDVSVPQLDFSGNPGSGENYSDDEEDYLSYGEDFEPTSPPTFSGGGYDSSGNPKNDGNSGYDSSGNPLPDYDENEDDDYLDYEDETEPKPKPGKGGNNGGQTSPPSPAYTPPDFNFGGSSYGGSDTDTSDYWGASYGGIGQDPYLKALQEFSQPFKKFFNQMQFNNF